MRDRASSLVQRHDLGVLVIALAILAGGALVHRSLACPDHVSYAKQGLQFQRPGGWLTLPESNSYVTPLALGTAGFGVGTSAPPAPNEPGDVHTRFASPKDARRRIEVRIEGRPSYSNLRGALAVQRLGQYGEFYWARSSGNSAIAGKDWLRTEFRYAFKPNKRGSPQIAEAIEYAIVNDERLFVVTLHDRPETLNDLDAIVADSLRVASQQASHTTTDKAPP
ncbi:MAG: hypothetical protein GY811_07315 [Myxococcales bacterium]|nr:hypothetical protein [Myxococcales bacterium]